MVISFIEHSGGFMTFTQVEQELREYDNTPEARLEDDVEGEVEAVRVWWVYPKLRRVRWI